ncbi:hypothetical protein [Thiohalorhabdus methylotrophus]|uniref:DUF2946 domain-containing protein n=1 Tax=Thiohalorhabdus methylotrophus TaxID=3242694 RepID=A0ABV4TVZ2_9GAMM
MNLRPADSRALPRRWLTVLWALALLVAGAPCTAMGTGMAEQACAHCAPGDQGHHGGGHHGDDTCFHCDLEANRAALDSNGPGVLPAALPAHPAPKAAPARLPESRAGPAPSRATGPVPRYLSLRRFLI